MNIASKYEYISGYTSMLTATGFSLNYFNVQNFSELKMWCFWPSDSGSNWKCSDFVYTCICLSKDESGWSLLLVKNMMKVKRYLAALLQRNANCIHVMNQTHDSHPWFYKQGSKRWKDRLATLLCPIFVFSQMHIFCMMKFCPKACSQIWF